MIELKDVLHYYLPYNVRIIISHRNQPDFEGNLTLPYLADCTGVKPILHHLSSLDAKYFKDNGIDLDAEIEIAELENGLRTINSMHFSIVQLCFKNHIDIFCLIESGQAIEK